MLKINKNKLKKVLFNILLTILVISLSVGLMLVFNRKYIYDENIFIIFILAVLIIIIETKSIVYGIIASLFLCSLFNFFLTEPQYSFVMNDLNYYISFIVFIIITVIFGSIVIKLQKKVQQARENEKRINILYDLSKKFLNCRGSKETFEAVHECLNNYLNFRFLIKDINENKIYGNVEEIPSDGVEAFAFAINQFTIVGKNQAVYSSDDFLIFPIRSKTNIFGAIYIELSGKDLSQSEFGFIKSISTETAVTLEREHVIKEQEISENKVAREHFKATLLRSLSHDLKTPLTSIQSGSLFLKDNLKNIDEEEVKELLDNIYNESVSLYVFVNNLLNISKITDKQSIVKEYESLYDIIQNVKEYFAKLKFSQNIVFPEVDESILVYCNSQLIIQVFINLIGNGIKYTREGSSIFINTYTKNNRLFVEIKDNGGGISDSKIKNLFNEEKTVSSKKDAYRSNGLGLIICQSIIEVHNGSIRATNNEIGGATFEFYIDLKKEETNNDSNN